MLGKEVLPAVVSSPALAYQPNDGYDNHLGLLTTSQAELDALLWDAVTEEDVEVTNLFVR